MGAIILAVLVLNTLKTIVIAVAILQGNKFLQEQSAAPMFMSAHVQQDTSSQELLFAISARIILMDV